MFLHGEAASPGLILGTMMHDERDRSICTRLRGWVSIFIPQHWTCFGGMSLPLCTGLEDFVRSKELAYGIVHDVDVTEACVTGAKNRIEEAFPDDSQSECEFRRG